MILKGEARAGHPTIPFKSLSPLPLSPEYKSNGCIVQYFVMVKIKVNVKVKADSSSLKPHLRVTGRHLPYGITQCYCYLPPDASERAPANPSQTGRYLIYLPRRDGGLS